jgi:hypothetical protein
MYPYSRTPHIINFLVILTPYPPPNNQMSEFANPSLPRLRNHYNIFFCTNPGQSGYVGSCRTGIKSVVTRVIGFGRLLLTGFRSYPLFFFDIRLSNSPRSDWIHTVRTDQIRSYRIYLL